MKLNKTLIVLLAVFMLILSAAAVSAEDGVNATSSEDDASDDGVDEDSEDVTDDEGMDNETVDVTAAPTDGEIGSPISAVADEPSSDLTKNPAGNPILVLLVAIAGCGIASIKRK